MPYLRAIHTGFRGEVAARTASRVSYLVAQVQRAGGFEGADQVIDDANVFTEKLQEWEDYYNYHRPHGALNGQTPYERLRQKTQDPLS